MRHRSPVFRNTNFSTRTRGKLHAPHIIRRRELIPRILLNSKANFKQAPQEEPSLTNRYMRGTLSFLCQVEWNRDSLTRNTVEFPWNGLNAGSSFIWQDEGMSESCVEILEGTLVPHLIWTVHLTSLDTLRDLWSSRLQKLTRLDSSLKLIGIPISLWKLERDTWFSTSTPEVSLLSCHA